MKYCNECGAKLEETKEKHTQTVKKKDEVNHKKNYLLRAAGSMILIAAILSIVIGFVGVGLSQSSVEIDHYYNHEYYAYRLSAEKLITGIFGLFGFIFGIISSVFLYTRKMFSLTIIGIGTVLTAASFSAFLGPAPFIMLGLPILIMGSISTVFTCISRKDFSF